MGAGLELWLRGWGGGFRVSVVGLVASHGLLALCDHLGVDLLLVVVEQSSDLGFSLLANLGHLREASLARLRRGGVCGFRGGSGAKGSHLRNLLIKQGFDAGLLV